MRLLFPLLAPAVLFAGWSEFRSGPFEILTEDGEKEAREALNYLEQLRNAVGLTLGQPDLQPVWPVRILMPRSKRAQPQPQLRLARDAYIASIGAMQPVTCSGVTQLLLDAFASQLPPNLERGMVTLFSTLQVDGTRVKLGLPPAEKDRDWSRAHMLTVHPDYSGKVRVLLSNLGKGVELEVAYKNAFEKTSEQIERELDRYIEAGQYDTYPVSGRPINAQKQFVPKPVDSTTVQLAQADLLMAADDPTAGRAYETLGASPEAKEGLGMIAGSKGHVEQAGKYLSSATSARGLVERAKLEKDLAQKKAALASATKANPRWAEPHRMLAAIEENPAQRLVALRSAANLEPRNPENWISLAEAQEGNKQHTEAAKSWTAAERLSVEPAARERIRHARAGSNLRRMEQEIETREEARRKVEQEMNDLRNKALMEIRAAEARANQGKPTIDGKKLDYYRDGPETKRVEGVLQRVDCLSGQARLQIQSGRAAVRVLVVNPENIVISGGGERSLACGLQKPGRKVSVEYSPKTDAKLGTAGEAVTIEFR